MPAKIKITIEEALNQRDEARNELERAIYRRDLALDKLNTNPNSSNEKRYKILIKKLLKAQKRWDRADSIYQHIVEKDGVGDEK